jgi:uncharacterized protein
MNPQLSKFVEKEIVANYMTFKNLLQPNLFLESVLNLTPEMIQQHQLKGLVLDVDETLVPITVGNISQDLQDWIEKIRPHVSMWLVSNNLSESRIGSIARSLDIPYFVGAAKPRRHKVRQAMEEMDLPFNQVAMVGDRLFTDVVVGNRLGMFTILVNPIPHPDTIIRIHPIRDIEFFISSLLGNTITLKQ